MLLLMNGAVVLRMASLSGMIVNGCTGIYGLRALVNGLSRRLR